jgi:hypothetical protein
VTHYDVLGVAPDAPAPVVRAAYLALARRHHPDYFVDAPPAARAEAEQRMRAVNEAWAVLSDPARRTAYDRANRLAPDPGAFRPIEPDEPGDVDPRLAPDVPYRRVPASEERRTRLATLVPIALFGAALGAVAGGLVIGVPSLLALGVVLFVLSCVGFVVLPLLVLSRATRDEG